MSLLVHSPLIFLFTLSIFGGFFLLLPPQKPCPKLSQWAATLTILNRNETRLSPSSRHAPKLSLQLLSTPASG